LVDGHGFAIRSVRLRRPFGSALQGRSIRGVVLLMARAVRMLLLDDEPLILLDLQSAAESAGYCALTACCCDEALGLIASEAVDVAVLDVSLGSGNTCAPVARRLADAGIPFVLYTGDPRHLAEEVRSLGSALVVKPACADAVVRSAATFAH